MKHTYFSNHNFSCVLGINVKDKYCTTTNESKTCYSAQRQPSGFSLTKPMQLGLDSQQSSYFKVSCLSEKTQHIWRQRIQTITKYFNILLCYHQEYLLNSGMDCEIKQVVAGCRQIATQHSSYNDKFVSVLDITSNTAYKFKYD